MDSETRIQTALDALDPQYKALRAVTNALKRAGRLAAAEAPDALPMQKALVKLQAAAAEVEDPALTAAVDAFAAETQQALDNLAFDFAGELRDAFAARGITVAGRPPTLTVGDLVLIIDTAARKGQWYYGKEPLTRPLPLSLAAIMKGYDTQQKRIAERKLNTSDFLKELYTAWQDCIDKRKQRPRGGRINLVELLSQITLNRQGARFWNAPARRTFKDYPRELFVRDLVLLRESGNVTLTVDGEARRFKIGTATKAQADQASRSIWLPSGPLDGQYYSDVTFD